jgi:hypothetical protein
MTTPTIAQTKLDAVNLMLASIGQSPVNTLTGTLPKDVNKAVVALDSALREVLTQGWSFNSDYDYELAVDGTSRIAVPTGSFQVEPTYGDDFVPRYDSAAPAGMFMYDRVKRAFDEFTQTLKVNIVWAFEFEQIPQHGRQYVATKAARKFQSGIMGSAILHQYTRDDESEAYATFRRVEKRQKNYNLISESVALNRHRNPTRR